MKYTVVGVYWRYINRDKLFVDALHTYAYNPPSPFRLRLIPLRIAAAIHTHICIFTLASETGVRCRLLSCYNIIHYIYLHRAVANIYHPVLLQHT